MCSEYFEDNTSRGDGYNLNLIWLSNLLLGIMAAHSCRHMALICFRLQRKEKKEETRHADKHRKQKEKERTWHISTVRWRHSASLVFFFCYIYAMFSTYLALSRHNQWQQQSPQLLTSVYWHKNKGESYFTQACNRCLPEDHVSCGWTGCQCNGGRSSLGLILEWCITTAGDFCWWSIL